jgi:hypothetical protein
MKYRGYHISNLAVEDVTLVWKGNPHKPELVKKVRKLEGDTLLNSAKSFIDRTIEETTNGK